MKKLIILVLIIPFSNCNTSNQETLTIAVAANMQFAIKEITEKFTLQTGVPCQTIISSSGKLTAQIKEGAPYDIFISANMKYPKSLHEEGLTKTEPKVYALGKLALWTKRTSLEPSIDLLLQNEIQHIALANPKNAPYGKAAMETLAHFDVLEQVDKKLIYGESIAQTNQFITTEAAEIGFTALSIIYALPEAKRGQWAIIDENTHSKIEQGIVILNNQKGQGASAQQFYDFLLSNEGKNILTKFGYLVN